MISRCLAGAQTWTQTESNLPVKSAAWASCSHTKIAVHNASTIWLYALNQGKLYCYYRISCWVYPRALRIPRALPRACPRALSWAHFPGLTSQGPLPRAFPRALPRALPSIKRAKPILSRNVPRVIKSSNSIKAHSSNHVYLSNAWRSKKLFQLSSLRLGQSSKWPAGLFQALNFKIVNFLVNSAWRHWMQTRMQFQGKDKKLLI